MVRSREAVPAGRPRKSGMRSGRGAVALATAAGLVVTFGVPRRHLPRRYEREMSSGRTRRPAPPSSSATRRACRSSTLTSLPTSWTSRHWG